MTGPDKAALRRAAIARREAAAHAAGPDVALAMVDNLLMALSVEGRLPPGGVVSGYWPIQSEADPRPTLDALAEQGIALALPRVEGPDIVFRAYAPGDELVSGPLQLQEPSVDRPLVSPSVLIVPLLAFDYVGGRLGYGAGYYDRALRRLRAAGQVFAVGLAFEAQKADVLPRDPWDEVLDAVATELRLREFVRGGR